ncbi:hypothetical protein [Bosea sp. (in: a-proteobacteria)]|uniref:glycosyltransferase n=1 Tax=Bosea sp. (in: a-proteobacteria) TaxID=1871050 RepID=UPI00262EB92D|nr:hypothetical protein [Bosea sp. (in: a-proteobacteria)]MCO5090666.1 hypothetical protein [Bosea sp. (in: a-proteobacteria)]
MKPLRILHGPVNVGNQPWSLSRAERKLGLRSDVVINYNTWLGYPADRTLSEYGVKSVRNRLRRGGFALGIPASYDVVHYYFGRSFLLWEDWGGTFGKSRWDDRKALLDVRLARAFGLRTFMTLQGCDVRQADRSHAINAITMCREGACPAFATCTTGLDDGRRAMIERLLPLMDRVFYLNPELGRFVAKGDFLPYCNVEIWDQEVSLPDPARRLRVVHAPSNGGIKGTNLLLPVLERLKQRFDFELILIENKPHAEAMALYRGADLAIDQLLAGWYGGFAVELMAMGKPVAAYIREEDRDFVPAAMWDELPVLRIDPRTLEDDLARILSAPGELVAAGRRSRAYVERWHDPMKTARAMARLYRDPSAALDLIQS